MTPKSGKDPVEKLREQRGQFLREVGQAMDALREGGDPDEVVAGALDPERDRMAERIQRQMEERSAVIEQLETLNARDETFLKDIQKLRKKSAKKKPAKKKPAAKKNVEKKARKKRGK